jgi:cytochrome c-type biogenesis protein
MDGLPLGLAVAAGMVAVVNPCGFALLPAYASFLILGEDAPTRTVAAWRALALAAAMTAGFVVVFGTFGLLLASAASVSAIQEYLPWFTLVLGLTLVVLGGWLLAGRRLPGVRIAIRGPAVARSASSMAAFGAAYATASLSCTLAPFLATVVVSFRTRSVGDGVAVFGAYALGMGLVIVAASLAVALAQTAVVTWLRRAGRLVPRIGGALLLGAGAYVAYYGWWEINVLRGDDPDDPIVSNAETVQRWLADGVDRLGAWGVAAIAAVLLALVIAASWLPRRRRDDSPNHVGKGR